jgi:hypothetical protein
MSDKKDQSMILCLHSQVSSLIKLIEEISIKKKKKKYGKTIEPIEKSIRQLAENAEVCFMLKLIKLMLYRL